MDWALGAAIVHHIKKQNTVIVSEDAVKTYDSFLPAYVTTTAEIGGMIITMATLYVCVCRGLLFGQGKTLDGRPAHGIGLGVLGSTLATSYIKMIAKFLKMHISSISSEEHGLKKEACLLQPCRSFPS